MTKLTFKNIILLIEVLGLSMENLRADEESKIFTITNTLMTEHVESYLFELSERYWIKLLGESNLITNIPDFTRLLFHLFSL